MRKAWTILVASVVVALAACAGDSTSSNAGTDTSGGVTTAPGNAASATTCSPSGTAISITAVPNAKLAFDKNCLAVPAGQDFTVTFDNQDNGVPHSFAILRSHDSSQVLFSTGQLVGPKKGDFKVTADKLPGAGTYHFHCEVHPTQMTGTFIVK